MTLAEMKAAARKALRGMVTLQADQYDEAEKYLISMSKHPQQASIEADAQAVVDIFTQVQGAADKPALKAAIKAYLDTRVDGDDWKRMLGKDDIIS